MKHVNTHKESVYKGEMYRIVFECVYVKIAIAFLFGAFFLQPIAPAYASELVSENSAVEEEVVEEVAPEPELKPELEPEEEIVEEAEEVLEESVDEVVASEEVDEVKEVVEERSEERDEVIEESGETIEEEAVSEEEDVAGGTEKVVIEEAGNVADDVATSTVTVVYDTASSTESGDGTGGGAADGGGSLSDPPHDSEDDPPENDVGDAASSPTATSTSETGTSTDDVSKVVLDESEVVEESTGEDVVIVDGSDDVGVVQEEETAATSSGEAVEVIEVVRYVNEFNSDLNKYQFADSECVNVGDGSFYCSKSSDQGTVLPEDAVFAERDTDGDREIFIRVDGKTIQITDNKLEDMAPHYDELSHSVVWHRLINDRYEIVSYDLKTEKETVLTNNNVNDMEPSHSGEFVVWQRWVEDNWEIVLFDGNKEVQITNSGTHDVGAHIKGGYVIWNTNDTSGERLVMVYEIETGLTSEIKDSDGGMVENPRFVLVYDTTHDNGDVITKGYDFESGEVVPLAAVPRSMPTDIPEPDATGETRALIQTKSSNNEDEIVEIDTKAATGTVKTNNVSATTTLSTDFETDAVASTTIDAEIEQATTTIDMTIEDTEVLPLTDFDLIVEPYFEASSTQEIISPSATSSVE